MLREGEKLSENWLEIKVLCHNLIITLRHNYQVSSKLRIEGDHELVTGGLTRLVHMDSYL